MRGARYPANHAGHTMYLTGVNTDATADAKRPDLGLLATPASGVYNKRGEYKLWAADNGFYAADAPDAAAWADPIDGEPAGLTASARAVRYGEAPAELAAWIAWIEKIDPADCLFATLPDVVGDHRATWERSAPYFAKVAALGFRPAFVLQNGLENDRGLWQQILRTLARFDGAVFVGGSPECLPCRYVQPKDSTYLCDACVARAARLNRKVRCPHCPDCDAKLTEWKLGAGAARLIRDAKADGCYVHMGRVNSYKRIAYAHSLGCDSADGTYLKFGKDVNFPKMIGWLDQLAELDPPDDLALAA